MQGAENWEKMRTEIVAKNKNLVIPEYYLKQFHACESKGRPRPPADKETDRDGGTGGG